MKPDTTRPAYVIGYAAVLSTLFTGAIMGLHVATRPVVLRNQRLLRQRALVRLFGFDRAGLTDAEIGEIVRQREAPGSGRLIVDDPDRTIADPDTGTRFQLIEAHDVVVDEWGGRRRERVGYAFPIWGVGFWARIDGLMAVDPTCSRALGVAFLKHGETPGLGGRITEESWTRTFRNLDITPPVAGGRYVYIGGPAPAGAGDPRAGRHVDAITGATGTSRAVETFINQRLIEFRRAAAEAGVIRGGPHGARRRAGGG